MSPISRQLQSKIQFHIVSMDSALDAASGYHRNRAKDDGYINACHKLVGFIKETFGSVANFSMLYPGSMSPTPTKHDVPEQAAFIAWHFRPLPPQA